MLEPFLEKQSRLKARFDSCQDADAKYALIIQLGREATRIEEKFKVTDNLVRGCQSQMHLHTYLENGKVYFQAESDALISNGLAVLLTSIYSGETPEAILKSPPDYLEALGISASLSPSRANGLASIYLRMKQEALKALVQQNA
jgi:cysteine desulfuration protein SufE